MHLPLGHLCSRVIALALLASLAPTTVYAVVDEGVAAYELGAYDIAIGHLERGAMAGSARAMTYLGYMERDGKVPGKGPDRRRAAEWFASASRRGNALAMRALGEMYVEGNGVAADPVEACKWFQLAVDLEPDAAAWLEAMASREAARQMLNPAQAAEADRRIKDWITDYELTRPGRYEQAKSTAQANRAADEAKPKSVPPPATTAATATPVMGPDQRLALACGDDPCCRAWYGEGKRPYEDLGIAQCRYYNPNYSNLDFWCSAQNNVPAFCQGQAASAWTDSGGRGKCFPPNATEEMPPHHGAGQPKYWIVWDPVAGLFGAPGPGAGMNKGLDEVARDNRAACRQRGGQKCYNVGGCVNAPTGVAVTEDRSWAFVTCGASSQGMSGPAGQAVAAARSQCEALSGCRCIAEDASQVDFSSWFMPLPSASVPEPEPEPAAAMPGVSRGSGGSCSASRHPTTASGWWICSICGEYRACLEQGGVPVPLPDGPGMDLSEVQSVCDNPYRTNDC